MTCLPLLGPREPEGALCTDLNFLSKPWSKATEFAHAYGNRSDRKRYEKENRVQQTFSAFQPGMTHPRQSTPKAEHMAKLQELPSSKRAESCGQATAHFARGLCSYAFRGLKSLSPTSRHSNTKLKKGKERLKKEQANATKMQHNDADESKKKKHHMAGAQASFFLDHRSKVKPFPYNRAASYGHKGWPTWNLIRGTTCTMWISSPSW